MNNQKLKREQDLKSEFYKFLNTNCKLSAEEENNIVEMNTLIMSEMKDERKSDLTSHLTSQSSFEDKTQSEQVSEAVGKVELTLHKANESLAFLNKVQREVEMSDEKLKQILHNRDSLSTILKEFNTKTKEITKEKEKICKLNESIETIYRKYENAYSIEAFFESSNEECVEKMRFITDYEEIENGINFFSLNTNYVEASNYLNTYNMLKRIALTRYYNYMAAALHALNKNSGLTLEHISNFSLGEVAHFILPFAPKNIKQCFYSFPKSFDKVVPVQIFFEKKAKYDYDVKMSISAVKNKFVDSRINLIRVFTDEILNSCNKEESANLKNIFEDISKMTLCEIIYFVSIFQTKVSDNSSILQKLISHVYETIYNNFRPIIVNSDNLDFLFILLDALSDNFGIFFLDFNSENKLEVKEKMTPFFNKSLISETLVDDLSDILAVAKNFIRPTILKIIQDVQEKVYFKINSHLRNSFLELECDLPELAIHEQKIAESYPHFNLFHFFLRRMAITFNLLRNKLDKSVLNELTIFAIEKFATLLNEEIVKEKTLTYKFEMYIIQQILLVLKLLEEFDLDAVRVNTEVDFYSLTEIFTKDYKSLVNWAPKVYDKTRDFKKMLFNNLLKAYKMLINLVNDAVFGRDIMDVVYKIRNKETVDKTLLDLRIKTSPFEELYEKLEIVILDLKTRVGVIDKQICEQLAKTIVDNLGGIVNSLRIELVKNKCVEGDYLTVLNIIGGVDTETDELDDTAQDQILSNLNNIKNSVLDI